LYVKYPFWYIGKLPILKEMEVNSISGLPPSSYSRITYLKWIPYCNIYGRTPDINTISPPLPYMLLWQKQSDGNW